VILEVSCAVGVIAVFFNVLNTQIP
jgi:hypothetical protein